MNRYLGIDGCRAGWFFVSIGPGNASEFGVFENIEKLYGAYSDAKWILIDIPIGLPYEDIPSRACDSQARKRLSPKRHHSIFSPPCREALPTSTYKEACSINQKITGRKISRQAYYIRSKILQVDLLLQKDTGAHHIIRESHPEICFWALAGGKPRDHQKKTKEGLADRLDILKQHFPSSSAIYKAALDRYRRKDVANDDILDALALVVSASKLTDGELRLPEVAEKDRLGLPMEMVCAIPEKPELNFEPSKQNIIIINDLEPAGFDTDSRKVSQNGSYSTVEDAGLTHLQIKTVNLSAGNSSDKLIHTVRFGPAAIQKLKTILKKL